MPVLFISFGRAEKPACCLRQIPSFAALKWSFLLHAQTQRAALNFRRSNWPPRQRSPSPSCWGFAKVHFPCPPPHPKELHIVERPLAEGQRRSLCPRAALLTSPSMQLSWGQPTRTSPVIINQLTRQLRRALRRGRVDSLPFPAS